MIEHIISETNWFAQECIAAKPDTEWHGMTLEEMKAFLRVHLLFGIKQLPANHLYWSSDPLIGVPFVEKACQKIILTNCLSTFIWIPTQDKFCKKIQDITSCSKFAPFWIMLLKIVETLWPGRNLSVDEAMVKFKGHLGMKQYLPVKPVKRGIKVWVCAEASSGYVCDFQVYTWKKQHGMMEQNLGYRVVHDLLQNFVRKNHHVFFDNFSLNRKRMPNHLRQLILTSRRIRIHPSQQKSCRGKWSGPLIEKQRGQKKN